MSYLYKVYGLYIRSEFKLQELNEVEEDENILKPVSVCWGKVPSRFEETLQSGRAAWYTKDEVCFHIEGLATFLILNGNHILIETVKEFELQAIKAYLLGSCMGFLLFQRGSIAIHGGAIMMEDGGVIFTGERGAGKSTLTSTLRKKGYKFITDDVAAIRINEEYLIEPGYPQQKLCEDIIEEEDLLKESYKKIQSDTRVKYLIPVNKDFHNEPIPLRAIYKIEIGEVEKVTIRELKGQEKLSTLYQNIFRIEFIKYFGMEIAYFKQCIDLVKDTPIYVITRPPDQMTTEAQIQCIKKSLEIHKLIKKDIEKFA